MKKIKKIFSVLLTLAMVLGMSMTTMAAAPTSKIEVNGLSAQEKETVNLYAAITLNEAGNAWVVAEWAKSYVTLDTANNKYTVNDWAGLSRAVSGTPIQQKHVIERRRLHLTMFRWAHMLLPHQAPRLTMHQW